MSQHPLYAAQRVRAARGNREEPRWRDPPRVQPVAGCWVIGTLAHPMVATAATFWQSSHRCRIVAWLHATLPAAAAGGPRHRFPQPVRSSTMHAQSADIASGLDRAAEQAQGARHNDVRLRLTDTPDLMPAPDPVGPAICKSLQCGRTAAHRCSVRLASQVSVRYVGGTPAAIETWCCPTSTARCPESAAKALVEEVIKPACTGLRCSWQRLLPDQPAAAIVVGGPHGDPAPDRRKLIVDTYGAKPRLRRGVLSRT